MWSSRSHADGSWYAVVEHEFGLGEDAPVVMADAARHSAALERDSASANAGQGGTFFTGRCNAHWSGAAFRSRIGKIGWMPIDGSITTCGRTKRCTCGHLPQCGAPVHGAMIRNRRAGNIQRGLGC